MEQKNTIENIRNKINDIKLTMIDNIQSILDRGDKLEEIAITTEHLQSNSIEFKRNSRSLKREMCKKYCGLVSILLFIILFVVSIITIIIVVIVMNANKNN